MKMQIVTRVFVFMAIAAVCLWRGSLPAAAEEVFYPFDFNDGVVPEELRIETYRVYDDPTATITCDASSGQLRIYDTVPVSCGLFLSPDTVFTDTYISTVISDPNGNCFLSARDAGKNEDYSAYGCWLWRPPHTDGVALYLDKSANGETVYSINTRIVSDPGPYIVELDVVDRETAEGVEYTAIEARLLYNDGQDSLTLQANDFGSLGGHERFTSGYALFGASLGSAQRDDGWLLDATFDDVTIRGTVVPEPSAITLLSLAFACVAGVRRRR